MKVYQIITKPHQEFQFYSKNGILTLCSDPKFPYIGGNSLYDGKTKTWIQMNNPMAGCGAGGDVVVSSGTGVSIRTISPDRVLCPHWYVEKTYYDEHMKEQMSATIETALQVFDKNDFNVFIFRKNIPKNKNLLAVSICAKNKLKGKQCHEKFTEYGQKHLRLKAFW
jgi:hypothetical protein